MVDFEPHKVIEDMLPETGIGNATMVFYIWFASRFPKGADIDTIQTIYGVGRRQAFRYLSKLNDLDLIEKRKESLGNRIIYKPNF